VMIRDMEDNVTTRRTMEDIVTQRMRNHDTEKQG
jgi:hypothetical protein